MSIFSVFSIVNNSALEYSILERFSAPFLGLLGLPRKSGRGISLREIPLCGRLLRGPGFAAPHRCFAVVAFCSFRARMPVSYTHLIQDYNLPGNTVIAPIKIDSGWGFGHWQSWADADNIATTT